MTIHVPYAYSMTFVALTIVMTHLLNRKIDGSGCMSFAYMGLIVFSINAFTIMTWALMYENMVDIYHVSVSGEEYIGTVISYTEEEVYDSESDSQSTMMQPTVIFTTNEGEIIEKELHFSQSNIRVGDTFKVNYNKETDSIRTLGFQMVIKNVGVFIFCFVFTVLFIGLVLFVSDSKMAGYYRFVSTAGFYFFLPILMIGFDALLIYSVFYGNVVPLWVSILLYFFIIVLTLGIWGYIKSLISNGKPKMKRVGPGKWISEWE